MAKILIKKPIDTLTLDEANEYLGENAKKRIDHARGALLKMVEAGEARVSTAKPKAVKEPKAPKPVLEHKWKESMYEGRQVYIGAGTGVVQAEATTDGVKYVQVKLRSGLIKAVKDTSVRFKAVNDKYREQYVKEEEIRTESGAPSIHCGDDLAGALLGTGLVELGGIAKENGLSDNYKKWVDNKSNPGMVRMNLSNMLRAKIKRGEAITIYGEDDLARAAEKARERYEAEVARAAEAKAKAAKAVKAAKPKKTAKA